MKKVIALILIAGLVLAMSGCTIPGQSNTTPTATAAATPTIKPTVSATVAPTGAADNSEETDPEVAKYKGTWQTNFGNMTFAINGKNVSGVYDHRNGTIEATLSDDGKTMEGMWYEEPTRLAPDDAGRFIFALSEDGNTINGQWWYGEEGDAGDWEGTRVGNNSTGF